MRVLEAIVIIGACAVPTSALSLIVCTAASNPDAYVGGEDVPEDLLSALRAITDPRCRRGVRHQLIAVLGVSVCAVLAGACSYVAIAEWDHDLPAGVRRRLRIERNPPSESAIRRVLQAIDPDLLDRTLCGWLASRSEHCQRWRPIAVDGKTARGARIGDGRTVHLLGALEHGDGGVLDDADQQQGASAQLDVGADAARPARRPARTRPRPGGLPHRCAAATTADPAPMLHPGGASGGRKS